MKLGDSLLLGKIYFQRKFPFLSKLFPKPSFNLGQWPNRIYGPYPEPPKPIPENEARVYYVGHCTVYIQILGTTIITDPVFTRRLGYHGLGLKRINGPPFLYQHIPQANFLLLTNNSFNCLNHTTLDIISARGASNILGGRNITFYIQKDMRNYVYPLDYFDKLSFGELSITFLPCIHKSYILPLGSFKNLIWHRQMLWGSFLIEADNKLIYISGATGYSDHFKKVKALVKPNQLDLAILPVGPIEPCKIYSKYNLSIEDAEKIKDLGAVKTLAIGVDTFPIGLDGYQDISSKLSKEFIILSPGCYINL